MLDCHALTFRCFGLLNVVYTDKETNYKSFCTLGVRNFIDCVRLETLDRLVRPEPNAMPEQLVLFYLNSAEIAFF
jgi:hypothetical protein